jgi:uncharacterized protein (DUF849 family)
MDATSNVEDLQAVSQHVLECAERISVLEEEKRQVDPASERFRTLSDEIEALAEEIRAVSHAETGVALDVAGKPGMPTIAEADQKR